MDLFKPCLDKYGYGYCSKMSYTKLANKMAYTNSADPAQTRSSLIRVFTVCLSTEYLKKKLHKKQNLGKKKVCNTVFKILGHLP